MEKKQRDLIAAGVLVSIFFLILAKGAFTGKKRPVAAAAVTAGTGVTDLSFLAAVRQNEELRQMQAAVWEKPWKRDPFLVQASSGAVAASRLKLIGIVWDENEPYAMVNEKVVKVGDVIDGYRVLEIKQASVTLWTDAGKFHELKLFEEGT